MNSDRDNQLSSSLRNLNSFGASTAFGVFAVLTAGALSPEVNAQSSAPQPSGTSTNAPAALPEVTVTGEQNNYKPETIASPRIAAPLRDTPQTVTVVPRAVIEEQNAVTLRDVLLNVPGISFQAGEGGVPAGDQLTIRGFPARTDIFIDGVRDVGGYTRDSFNVEQVEVFKGPNSAYAGRGSTGGSVNLVTKTPKLNPFYQGAFSYGSDNYFRAAIDVNQPIKDLEKIGIEGASLRLNGLFHEQDFADRDYIHDERVAINPTLAFGLGTNTRVKASYMYMGQDNLAGYGLPFVNSSNNPYGGASALGKIAPVPFNRFFGLVNRDFEEITQNLAGLRLEHDFSEDLKLANNTRYGRTYRDSVITAPRIIRNPAADPEFGPNTPAAGNAVIGSDGAFYGLNHEFQSRDQGTDIISNQTEFRTDFETWKFEHSLFAGFEYSHERELNYLRSATVGTAFPYPAQTSNPLDPNPFDPFHPYFRTGARNEAIVDAGGISVFDTIKLSEKFILTAGLRGDVFSAEYNQRAVDGTMTTFDRTDTEFTWRSGLTYKPLPNGSVYFGYGTSFNPSAEGFTLTGGTQALEPEKGESFELGSKWDFFEERFSVAGALFRSDKSNYRNTDPVTTIVSTTGDVRVEGIELQVVGKLTDKWALMAGYTLMRSEILKSRTVTTYDGVAIPEQGKSLNNVPNQSVTAATSYQLPYNFAVGTAFTFTDARYSNNIETQGVPGYWTQNALVSWRANEHIDFRVNVSNLWDEKFIDRVGGGHAIPGAGRTVILTANLKF